MLSAKQKNIRFDASGTGINKFMVDGNWMKMVLENFPSCAQHILLDSHEHEQYAFNFALILMKKKQRSTTATWLCWAECLNRRTVNKLPWNPLCMHWRKTNANHIYMYARFRAENVLHLCDYTRCTQHVLRQHWALVDCCFSFVWAIRLSGHVIRRFPHFGIADFPQGPPSANWASVSVCVCVCVKAILLMKSLDVKRRRRVARHFHYFHLK